MAVFFFGISSQTSFFGCDPEFLVHQSHVLRLIRVRVFKTHGCLRTEFAYP